MKKIELTSTSTGYEMQFLSGVKAPLPDTPGFYLVNSACGDGKTTQIKNIVQKFSSLGILIVTQTTEAADTLFKDLGKRIGEDKICLLHSQPLAFPFMTEHREKPTGLWNYPVLIITAVRLQHYPSELFSNFGFLGKGKREFILIDEIISFFPEYPLNPISLLPDISFISPTKRKKRGILVSAIKTGSKNYYNYIYDDSLVMEAGVKANPKNREYFKSPLAQYRLRSVLNHLSNNGLSEPKFEIMSLVTDSKVLLFDGTADVLFPQDPRLLISSASKYNSDIDFRQFHIPFRRHNDKDWDIDILMKVGKELFQKIAERTKNEKILIVTWMDIDKKITKKSKTDELEGKISYSFPDIISEVLDGKGAVKDNYGVIYRGSGLERGCNDFKDFETIIFLGEWFISDDITSKLNEAFGGKCCLKDYKKSLLVQSICRLRIRKHEGLPIKVEFSDDIDYNLIFEVQKYFRQNSKPGCKIDGVLEPIEKLNKREKNYLFDIALIGTEYPELVDAITSHKPLSIDVPKAEIYRILPKDRNSPDRYSSLLKYLNNLNIFLNIS